MGIYTCPSPIRPGTIGVPLINATEIQIGSGIAASISAGFFGTTVTQLATVSDPVASAIQVETSVNALIARLKSFNMIAT